MRCNESNDLTGMNYKWELEVYFVELDNKEIDYVILSEKLIDSCEGAEVDGPYENLILKQQKVIKDLFYPQNRQRYYHISQETKTINEKIFIPLFSHYLDIKIIPEGKNVVKFFFTFQNSGHKTKQSTSFGLEKYQHLLENASDWILVIDENAEPLFVGHAAKNILGYSESESFKINALRHVAPSDLPFVMEKFKEVKQSFGKMVKLRCHLIKSDSTYIRVEIKAKNCFDIDGINGIVVNVTDISNQEMITSNINLNYNKENEDYQLGLGDLLDLNELNQLMRIFNKFSNIPVIIVDLKGNILTSINMTEMCTNFHRKNTASLKRCIQSDTELTSNLEKDEIRFYKCLNRMNDLVSPIFVGDKHIANFFVGEFFFADEDVDYGFFRQQAKELGFDEKEYMAALDKVPRVDRDKVMLMITFYRDLIKIITTLANSKIKLVHLNKSLEQREEKLKQITDNMTDVVITTDLDFNITYVSPSIEKLTGFTLEEYKKLSMTERYPRLAIKEIKETITEELAIDKLSSSNMNRNIIKILAMFTKQKKLVITSLNSKFLRNGRNKPIGIIANIRNITDKVKVENALARQLNLQSLLSTIAVKYINISTSNVRESIKESLIQLANFLNTDRAYISDFDWEQNICVNTYNWCTKACEHNIEDFHNIPLSHMTDWTDTLKMGKTILINDILDFTDKFTLQKLNHKNSIKSLIAVPLMRNSECIGFLSFESVRTKNTYSRSEQSILSIFAELLVNIDNRIMLEKELREERRKAQDSDNLKSNLLKNISHEFRTPLNGIVGFSELLQQQSIDVEASNMANMIYSSAIRLNHVLDSIMLLTQLEELNRKEGIILKTANVSNVLLGLDSIYKDQFRNKNLSFTSEIEADLYAKIDDKLLNQALIHLLNNALKFTHHGSVKLIGKTVENKVFIDIIDTGVGIPNESQKIIFSDFRQASEGYNRAYEGVGLGLTIAKKTVDLMNGEISVKSKILEGSTFTITLPLCNLDKAEIKKLEKQHIEQSFKIDIDKPKILIVEDNIINQKLVISILKQAYTTDLAVNGEVAVALTEKKKYDAILMDIHLGEGIDGLAATKIIRESSKNLTTPIIAVTGYTMYGDKERILAGGCNFYLSKPYKKKELIEVLNTALSDI